MSIWVRVEGTLIGLRGMNPAGRAPFRSVKVNTLYFRVVQVVFVGSSMKIFMGEILFALCPWLDILGPLAPSFGFKRLQL